MQTSSRGSGTLISAPLLVLLAAANAFALYRLSQPDAASALTAVGGALATGDAQAAFRTAVDGQLVPWLAIPVLGPLLIAVLTLVLGRAGRAATQEAAAGAEAEGATDAAQPEPEATPGAGLRLLATLQEEARLVDFVREDIDGYSDAEIGSAVRGIHAALRRAIDERLVLEPILQGEDGDPVEVPSDFEPAMVRVTGKVTGGPPYRGVLRHGGWRARDVRLPVPSPGSDPTIIMPAEVEVGAE